jgi:hypothetical protein
VEQQETGGNGEHGGNGGARMCGRVLADRWGATGRHGGRRESAGATGDRGKQREATRGNDEIFPTGLTGGHRAQLEIMRVQLRGTTWGNWRFTGHNASLRQSIRFPKLDWWGALALYGLDERRSCLIGLMALTLQASLGTRHSAHLRAHLQSNVVGHYFVLRSANCQ